MTALSALWFGLIVGAVVLAALGAGAGLLYLWRRRRAKRTFLRSRDGTIVQLYGPYRRRR